MGDIKKQVWKWSKLQRDTNLEGTKIKISGPVVGNPPAYAADVGLVMGSVPGPGRFHVSLRNQARVP